MKSANFSTVSALTMKAMPNVAAICAYASVAVLLLACLFLPSQAIGQNKRILVISPHPDDEALCCSGVIYAALQSGDTVNVAVMTNGDYYSPGTPLGYTREAETIAGMATLGVNSQNVIFLGYGDETLQEIYQSTDPTTIFQSQAGATQTYANQGLGGVSYHQYLYGSRGDYNRQTVLGDVEALLRNLQPTDVYTTSIWDDHPDHQSTFAFLVEAILNIRNSGVSLPIRVHETLVHAPCSACGVPTNSTYIWPEPVFTPTQPFAEPYYLESMTPYLWSQAEHIEVPPAMQNPNASANLKYQTISKYPSQGEDSNPNLFLWGFVREDEFFWVRDFTTNVAGLATATASSQGTDPPQPASSATDGIIEGFPGYQPWEWVSNGQLAGAWLKLTWPKPMTISQVVLYSRMDGTDDIQSGTLAFSDGSSVPVGQLPVTGNGYLVSFPPKTVTSMQLNVTNASGEAVGLTEIEVYGSPSGTTVNEPQIFQGPTSSAPVQTDAYGQNTIGSISDSQTTSLSVQAFDVDAKPLTYTWTADAGTLSGQGTTAIFQPPVVSAPRVIGTTVQVSDGQGGTTQNMAFVNVTPSNTSGISVSSLSFNPANLAGGSTGTGTVSLNEVAPAGAVVTLTNGNPSIITMPATVTVPPGSATGTFTVGAAYVATNISISMSASLGGVTQSAQLTVLQPLVFVTSLVANPATVGGGNPFNFTIGLNAPAAAGGAVISLTNSQPGLATVPATVTIPGGATSGSFSIPTPAVTSATSGTISALYVGQTVSAGFRVAPYVSPNLATIAKVTASSETPQYGQLAVKAVDGIVDGSPGDYTKEWATQGQLGGAWINLSWSVPVTTGQVILYDRPNLTDNVTSGTLTFSDGSSVPVGQLPNSGSPLTVTFPSRSVTWMRFTVGSAVGENIGLAEIEVIGSATPASGLSGLTLSPTAVTGGTSSTATVILNGDAPSGGTVISLSSSNNVLATVPPLVTVPQGANTVTFPVSSSVVNTTTTLSISATYDGTQTAILTIVPVAVSSITVAPQTVTGGSGASATVTLNAPAPQGGATVTLGSSNSTVAGVPATLVIAQGGTTGTFQITTTAVQVANQTVISANYNGNASARLLVAPVVTAGGGMQLFAGDNFSRADGGLGPNWTTVLSGAVAPVIQSDQVQSNWGRAEALYYGGINWPADQYAQAQITAQSGGSVGPAVRMTSNGTFYAGTIGGFGTGTASAYILLGTNEGLSVLTSTGNATVLPNDVIQLSVQGTTLILTDVTNSTVLVTATDSTVTAGYPGFYIGGTGTTLTNWSAGVTAAPPSLTTLASDNFNRANNPNLGSNWTVGPGLYSIQIVSSKIESDGQGQAPGQGHGKEFYSAVSFSSDQWSTAQVISSTNDINGALVRYQGTTDTHYVGFVSALGGPGSCAVAIDLDFSGQPSQLVTDSTYCSVSAGDYLSMQARGSLLSYIDVTSGALLLTVVDTKLTGGAPGWSLDPIGGTPTAANWSGGGFSE